MHRTKLGFISGNLKDLFLFFGALLFVAIGMVLLLDAKRFSDILIGHAQHTLNAEFTMQRSAEMVLQETFSQTPFRFRLVGTFLTVTGIALFLFRMAIFKIIQEMPADTALVFYYAKKQIRSMSRRDSLTLFSLMVIALGLRLQFLNQPIRGDEAATYLYFASRPLYIALSYYPVPNNHLFYTFLVNIVSKIGFQPEIIRMPSLIAGFLLIPVTYCLGKRLFSSSVGLMAAALVTTSSYLIEYSTLARGYTTQTFLSLLGIFIATYLITQNNRFLLLLFWGTWTLAFYTIPPTLYIFLGTIAWMGLIAFKNRKTEKTGVQPDQIIGLSFAIGFTTVFLYIPVILLSGPESILWNRFVIPLDWTQFFVGIGPSLYSTLQLFHRDLPYIVVAALIFGFFISLGILLRQKSIYALLPIVILAGCTGLVVIQRVVPFERVWIFLIPIYLIFSSQGLHQILTYLHVADQHILTGFGILIAVLSIILLKSPSITNSIDDTMIAAEPIAQYLKNNIREEDRVFNPNSMVVYYMRLYGVPESSIVYEPSEQASRFWIIWAEDHPPVDGIQPDQAADHYLSEKFPDLSSKVLVKRFSDARLYLLSISK